ncbi:hypothetical protein N0754_18830 [Pseudomonas aeruginosa]|nr:hypothetical protein [Pseudomonas aeruginosa]MCS9764292.1 hypothetical protein [Pseudomonas aeruginosa]MCS9820468.1 hypothetical protein [Pseudomonas aeruginosa]MCT0241049.1 hypothetical protein [Pseudomonas aeruginosa]MCT0528502.1 hypothetical protein [Pseudomonas aeruginosa]
MADQVRSEIRVAKLSHPCMASHWFEQSGLGQQDLDPAEWASVLHARSANGQIEPGQQYLYQVNRDSENALVVFKARLEMNAICRRYGLYPES